MNRILFYLFLLLLFFSCGTLNTLPEKNIKMNLVASSFGEHELLMVLEDSVTINDCLRSDSVFFQKLLTMGGRDENDNLVERKIVSIPNLRAIITDESQSGKSVF